MWHKTANVPWADGGEGRCIMLIKWFTGTSGYSKDAQDPEIFVIIIATAWIGNKYFIGKKNPTQIAQKWSPTLINQIWILGDPGKNSREMWGFIASKQLNEHTSYFKILFYKLTKCHPLWLGALSHTKKIS